MLRYDHMQAVCEILPAGIPSLALCLQTIMGYNESDAIIFAKTKEITKCNYDKSPTGFILDPKTERISTYKIKDLNSLYHCEFPGASLYNWLLALKIVTKNFETSMDQYSKVLNPFNLKYNFFNSMIYEKTKELLPVVRKELKQLEASGEVEFDKYFYADLYEELTNVYIYSYIDIIDKKTAELNKTQLPEFAPVRPFNKIDQSLI